MNAPRTRVQRRPVHGVLLLDKPLGLSSNDALQKAKWLLRAEKAGHTGTLDPLATGVLPLCFGAATKFSQMHLDAHKTYEAVLRLGQRTTTADAEGELIAERPVAYTAERGYELVPMWDNAAALWDTLAVAIAARGGRICGLGARDTLRTEMGYPLHGNDLSLEITPVMAGSGWAVGWDKPTFWGKEALVAQRAAKTSRLSRGLLVTGRGTRRPGCPVLDADGALVGEVTSGTFSPTRKQGIALALLDRSVAIGDAVSIDVRGRLVEAEAMRPPFVEVSTKEN